MLLQFARPKGKPALTSTDKGHGACLPGASSCSQTVTVPKKQL